MTEEGTLGTILVADDELASRVALCTALGKLGYQTVAAADGYELLRERSQREFDAIIVDIRMPNMDGLEAARLLRSNSPDDVIIFLGSPHDFGPLVRSNAAEFAAKAFLSKPIHMGELRRLMERVLNPASAPAADQPAMDIEGPPGQHCSVLVVDDEEPVREALAAALSARGYDVVTAGDGDEALFYHSQMRFDAVVLDVKMPGLSGFNVLREMQMDQRPPAVIMITGVADPIGSLATEVKKLGAEALLYKPVRTDELTGALRQSVEKARKTIGGGAPGDGAAREEPEGESEDSGGARRWSGSAPGQKPVVLVVDDDAAAREGVAKGLAKKGYDVISAPDGESALSIIGTESVDAIILDIRMPETTGTEVLQRLRTEQCDAVVVMLTGIADPEGKVEAESMDLGANAFLKKPISLADLDRTLEDILGAPPPEPAPAQDPPSPTPTADPEPSPRLTILVVDDEEPVRTAVAAGLSRRGYDVVTAQNGQEALFYCSQERFDVMVLDVRMPEITGLEVLHRLKEKYSDAVVVMLTAVADPDQVIEKMSVALGAHAFLKKPIRVADLDRALRDVLSGGGADIQGTGW